MTVNTVRRNSQMETKLTKHTRELITIRKRGEKERTDRRYKDCETWAKDNGCVEFGSDCELDNIESFNFHLKVGFTEVNRVICFNK